MRNRYIVIFERKQSTAKDWVGPYGTIAAIDALSAWPQSSEWNGDLAAWTDTGEDRTKPLEGREGERQGRIYRSFS